MKRIGHVIYTARPRKGTSRAVRQKAWHAFVFAAKIMNAEIERLRPAMEQAQLDALVYGTAAVEVTWDERPSGNLHVRTLPYVDLEPMF